MATKKENKDSAVITYSSEHRSLQNTNLSVTKPRNRIGCDICKKDSPTECFQGWCGNVLWICGTCFKEITKSKNK